jgi:hypothetical protein
MNAAAILTLTIPDGDFLEEVASCGGYASPEDWCLDIVEGMLQSIRDTEENFRRLQEIKE